MKKIMVLAVVICSIALNGIAQKDSSIIKEELNKKVFGTKDNFVGGRSMKLVAFIGYNMNKVSQYFNNYLCNDFGFVYKSSTEKPLTQLNATTYLPNISNSTNRKIVTHYQLNESMEIVKYYIDGYWTDIIKLFCNYWDTTIDFEQAKKQQTAVKFCYTDKIILTVNSTTKYAKIEIVRNK